MTVQHGTGQRVDRGTGPDVQDKVGIFGGTGRGQRPDGEVGRMKGKQVKVDFDHFTKSLGPKPLSYIP